MRFFCDRNVPPQLARMINAFDQYHTIMAYNDDDRFTETTPDVEWIKVLESDGDPPWIIISGDGRILKNPTELLALRESQLSFFCLTKQWMVMKIHDQAWRFLKVWPDIVENAKGSNPKIFEVSAGSGLKVERKHF